jgi:Na+/phosphate symporter
MKICLRPRAAGSAELLSFHNQLHRPNSIVVAAIGGGAMFIGTRMLEQCQKNLTGGSHD